MRRRFGRRRPTGGADDTRKTLDVPRLLERIEASGVLEAQGLVPFSVEGLPPGLAAIGSGATEAGDPVRVSFSPRDAGDALLAGLAAAAEGEPFTGTLWVLAPSWSLPARRKLALLGETPFTLRAAEVSELGEGGDGVQPEPFEETGSGPRSQLATHLTEATERALAERAMKALSGLAAKHGGTIRLHGRSLELVLLARRVAAVRIDDDGVLLDTLQPQRRTERLSLDGLAEAFDRLEGGLRKRLGDREVRDGEEGLRARAIPALASLLGLRAPKPWPRGGTDFEAIDLAGVDPEGHPVLASIRERLGLEGLGAILDAAIALRPTLPSLLADAGPPIRIEAPRLALAVGEQDPLVGRVLRWLAVPTSLIELRRGAGREPELALGGEVRSAAPARRITESRSAGPAHRGEDLRSAGPDRSDREPRGRGRGRGRRDERGMGERAAREPGPLTDQPAREAGASTIDEVSLFDLDLSEDAGAEDLSRDEAGGARRGRRRRRGRGRSRRPQGSEGGTEARDSFEGGEAEEQAPRAEAREVRPSRERGRERGRREPQPALRSEDAHAETDEDLELGDGLVPLSPEAPDFVEEPEVPYEEEEESEEESDPEQERMRHERELRRRARVAKAAPLVHAEPPRERPQRPKRVAILAHADRDSVAAAVLLARDLRLLEGLWVYPQSELMTFFRGVATDLREETPIHVVGFSASPARDVLQAAALYRDRLVWYDHHEWPPEDVEGLRAAVGSEAVHLTPGARSALPSVLARSARRSRFSDKLVDLICARFTQHDYERWGRLWWSRLEAIASRSGERRADLEPLLVGRPSDLARAAAAAETPPPPPEVDFVAGQDFRLVHFGGHSLVVVTVPPTLDLHLAARIARERYGAGLSLGWEAGEECVVLAADEQPGRRPLDVVAVVELLAEKHEWVTALPYDDHVARMTVSQLALRPDRVDELLSGIAMSRSTLEG